MRYTLGDIKSKVIETILENGGGNPGELSGSSNILFGAGLDSFSFLNVIMELELDFDIKISTEDLSCQYNQTVQGLSEMISQRVELS